MKKLKNNDFKFSIAAFVLFISFSAYAQKIPKIQVASILAPDNVKIDGKPTEWDDKYQAYNSVDHFFYTIANDDKNLYLVVHSTNRLTIEKMVRWGIAFTVSSSVKKREKDVNNISISYPDVGEDLRNLSVIHNIAETDILTNKDSVMTVRNTKISNIFKLIKVTGIKDISEPSISVYNNLGIKAVASFDKKLAYNCEMALPLKYLAISINNRTRFSYNIKLNGGTINPAAPPAPVVIGRDGAVIPQPDHDYLLSPTDFWGEYTLAKK